MPISSQIPDPISNPVSNQDPQYAPHNPETYHHSSFAEEPIPIHLSTLLGIIESIRLPLVHLVLISDDQTQAKNISMRMHSACKRAAKLKPDLKDRCLVLVYPFPMDIITQAVTRAGTSADKAGRVLIETLCENKPVDFVLGVGEYGSRTVADLRRQAYQAYPECAETFFTQTEMKQEATDRGFAGENDAYLMAIYERLCDALGAKTPED